MAGMDRDRFVVSDAVRAKVADLLPGKATDPGATGKDNRPFPEAVLWRVGPGASGGRLPGAVGRGGGAFPGVLGRGWGGGVGCGVAPPPRRGALGSGPRGDQDTAEK